MEHRSAAAVAEHLHALRQARIQVCVDDRRRVAQAIGGLDVDRAAGGVCGAAEKILPRGEVYALEAPRLGDLKSRDPAGVSASVIEVPHIVNDLRCGVVRPEVRRGIDVRWQRLRQRRRRGQQPQDGEQ